jgi:hypothetical protein
VAAEKFSPNWHLEPTGDAGSLIHSERDWIDADARHFWKDYVLPEIEIPKPAGCHRIVLGCT